MNIDIRMPNITGASEREQLAQIRSYLYQFVPQLQWALNTLETSAAPSSVAENTMSTASPSSNDFLFNATVAFDALKPLIIKSAEIVQAYYDEISTKLHGVYVAESDFGTYIEKTEQTITQNSTNLTQLFENYQQILTDLENLDSEFSKTQAYIQTGLLDDTVTPPVYGIEIGQESETESGVEFKRFARFTADKLSFFDQNEDEVAYISNFKLFIKNVEITSSYQIGGFRDTVATNGDVLTKWVGGYS